MKLNRAIIVGATIAMVLALAWWGFVVWAIYRLVRHFCG